MKHIVKKAIFIYRSDKNEDKLCKKTYNKYYNGINNHML